MCCALQSGERRRCIGGVPFRRQWRGGFRVVGGGESIGASDSDTSTAAMADWRGL